MNDQEALKALNLEGGLEIKGRPLRVAQFFEALDIAISALEEREGYIKQIGNDSMNCVANGMSEDVSKLIDYIMNNMHWCPFKDEADINFDKECVGFREKGCKECIYRNIDKLN